MKSLKETAMRVRPSLSMWTARKFDKKVTGKVIEDHGASKDAGRWNKLLIAQDAIKKLVKLKGEFWTEHYRRTVPWTKDGWALLTTKGYYEYMEFVSNFKTKWEGEVWLFVMNYPAMVDDAKARLNGMWNENDYPDAADIKEKFNFDLDVDALPNSKDFRVDIKDDEVKRIRDLIEEKGQERLAAAMKDVWKRLYDQVNHISTSLKNPKKVFRDSLIGNVTSLVNILPSLNITNDPDLERLRREVEAKLGEQALDPQELRTDSKKRAEAAKSASAILGAMSAYTG